MLKIENLNAFYSDFQALFGINMELREGETLALIGANGAGKTSLLNGLCGLVETTGTILLDNEEMKNKDAAIRARKGIGLSPEGRRMFTSLTVQENLLMGQNVNREGYWNLSTVCEIFPILGEFANRSAGLLSGGQQQMVAIGRALISNPKLLLLDEVSLGLAPVIAQEVHRALAKLRNKSSLSVIIVEQDVNLALSASDRFMCLLEGRCVLEGDSKTADMDALSKAYFGEAS